MRYDAASGDDASIEWDGRGGLPGRIAVGASAADPAPRSSTRTPTTWVRRDAVTDAAGAVPPPRLAHRGLSVSKWANTSYSSPRVCLGISGHTQLASYK